jgi:hypothetical protein
MYGNRLYSTDGSGLLVRSDQLALAETGDGFAFSISGIDPTTGEIRAISITNDDRLRVDSRPALEERNLWRASAWRPRTNVWARRAW